MKRPVPARESKVSEVVSRQEKKVSSVTETKRIVFKEPRPHNLQELKMIKRKKKETTIGVSVIVLKHQ